MGKKKKKHKPDDIIIGDHTMFYLDQVLKKVQERKEIRELRTKS